MSHTERGSLDLVFWPKKGKDSAIVFINPKGIAHTKTYWKLDGYRHLFEEKGKPRRIAHEGSTASVRAFCYNRNAARASELHRRFWVGSIAELLKKVSA